MDGMISKSLSWGGSIRVEPHAFDLLKFFAPREGLRVSGAFTQWLSWVIYTRKTYCGRVCADCFDLRMAVRDTRLRKEMPTAKAFQLAEGLCLVAFLVGEQFGGREGWLLADGSANVFLVDVAGQVVAVSVSCLDDGGEFFVDEWWLLLDKAGPLRTRDRVFAHARSDPVAEATPTQPPAWEFSVYAPETQAVTAIHAERRAVKRGFYRTYGLGGHLLQAYLRRHTAKRFCKACATKNRS